MTNENKNFQLPDVDQLARDDAADKKKENNSFKSNKKKRDMKKLVVPAVSVISLGVLTFGFFLINPFGESETVIAKKAEPGVIKKDNTNNQDPVDAPIKPITSGEDFATKEGTFYPVKYIPEELESSQELSDEEKQQVILQNFSSLLFGKTGLPSMTTGFTSNVSEEFLDDGTLNPRYSYLTDEYFSYSVGHIATLMINPHYGEWVDAQYPNNKGGEPLYRKYLASNLLEKTSNETFLFEDVNDDNYGGLELLDYNSRWMGRPTDVFVDLTFDDKTKSYSGQVIIDVKYSAWLKDQSVAEKNGTLTLNIEQSGLEGLFERIIVTDIEFVMEDNK